MKEKKFYLTKEGLKKIQRELKILLALRSKKTQGEIPKILESEEVNPEYLSFQEDLEIVDTRIADLKQILKYTQIITPPSPEKQGIVNLGATVLVKMDDQIDEFEIVGTLEANPSLGKISNESLVGKSLIGHRVGDEVEIQSSVPMVYKILKINYNYLKMKKNEG